MSAYDRSDYEKKTPGSLSVPAEVGSIDEEEWCVLDPKDMTFYLKRLYELRMNLLAPYVYHNPDEHISLIGELIYFYKRYPKNTLLLIELISCCNAYPVPKSFLVGNRKRIADTIPQIKNTAIEMVHNLITASPSTLSSAPAVPGLFPPRNTSSTSKTTEQKLNDFIRKHLINPLKEGKTLPTILDSLNDYIKFKLFVFSKIPPYCTLLDNSIFRKYKTESDNLQYIKQLKDDGFSARELREAGFYAGDLRAATNENGDRIFSDDQILHAGFDASELRKAGFSLQELLDAGFSPWDILSLNLPVNDLEFSLIKDPDSDFPPTSTATSSAPICTVCTAENPNHRHRSDRILILDWLLREIMKNDSSLWPQKLMVTNCKNNIVDPDTAHILAEALYKIQQAKSIEDLQNVATTLNDPYLCFRNPPVPIIHVPAQVLYNRLDTIEGINLQGQVADSVATFRDDSFLRKIASAILRTNPPLQPIRINQIVPLIRDRIEDPGADAHVQPDIETILEAHIQAIVDALIVPPHALMPDLIPAIMRLLPQRALAQYFRMPITTLISDKTFLFTDNLRKQRHMQQCSAFFNTFKAAYRADNGPAVKYLLDAFLNGSQTYINAQREITNMPLLTPLIQSRLRNIYNWPLERLVTSEQKYNKFIGTIHPDAVTKIRNHLPVFDSKMLPRDYFQFPLDENVKDNILKLLNGKIGDKPFTIGACTPLRQPTSGIINFNEAIRTNNIIVVLKNTTKDSKTATIQDIDHILFPYQFIKLFGIRIPELFSKKEIPVLFYPNQSS